MINQTISQKLVIEKAKLSYNNQFRASIKVTIEPTKKAVRNNWKNWLNEKHGIKVNGSSWFTQREVLSAKRVRIPAISDKQFDLYTKVVEQGQGSEMYIFASFGNDMHITPEISPKEYHALENFVLEFLTDFLTNYYRNLKENLEETLSDLAKNKNTLQENLSSDKKEGTS